MKETTFDTDSSGQGHPQPTADERYRAFIENSAEGIWRFETHTPISTKLPVEEQITAILRDGYLAECNDACARMYGFQRADELTGTPLSELLSPENPANQAYLFAFIQSRYHLTDAVFAEADRDGNPLYFSNSLTGVVENGYLIRAWGTQRDITAQRRAEDALRESEHRFRDLADSAPVMIWMSDTSASCDWFNRPWLEFTGRTMEQDLGSGWAGNVHPDDVARLLEAYHDAFAARRSLSTEYRLRRWDGVYRWVLDSSKPRCAETDGHAFLGYIGSCVDITAQKEAEAKLSEVIAEQAKILRHQRDFLKDVLRSTTDDVFNLCDGLSEFPAPLPLFAATENVNISAPTLALLRQHAREAAGIAGLSSEQTSDLVTAVGESSMNIVVHATQHVGSGKVCADPESGTVQVWLRDDGPGIPVQQLHRAVLERGFTTAGSLGHGFFLLLKCADRVYLMTNSETGTTMVIEKFRAPQEPEWLTRTRTLI